MFQWINFKFSGSTQVDGSYLIHFFVDNKLMGVDIVKNADDIEEHEDDEVFRLQPLECTGQC